MDTGKWGKKLSCLQEIQPCHSVQTRILSPQEMAYKKNCHCLGDLGIGCPDSQLKKEIGRDIKDPQSSTVTINHFITSRPSAFQ